MDKVLYRGSFITDFDQVISISVVILLRTQAFEALDHSGTGRGLYER